MSILTSAEFVTGNSFVLEVRPGDLTDLSVVRCTPRRLMDFLDTMGARVLLHAPRQERTKGYFAHALIDGFEPDPVTMGMFVFLKAIKLFKRPVSTLNDGTPWENAPKDTKGNLAFSFYANGLRAISESRFDDILDAARSSHTPATLEFAEFLEGTRDPAETKSDEEIVVDKWQWQQRRIRARLRAQLFKIGVGAFCCMSGASFDVPGGVSLLQLSHFRPLSCGGLDILTNVGFKTANIHPIYENGLVTARSDFSLCFAPDIPPGFLAEFRGRTQMSISGNSALDPAEENLAYHREEIFARRLKKLGLSRSVL